MALSVGAGLLPALGAHADSTSPLAQGEFRAVQVDVAPLVAIGGGASATLIAQILPAKLAASFADRLTPHDARAPILVARIARLFLSAYSDAPSPGIDSFSNMDSMEGSGIVLAGRQVLSNTPLRVTLPASYSGPYYLPDIDQRRIDSLCDSFASWLSRGFTS